MYPPVATNDPAAVELEVQRAYLAMFPAGDRFFVPRVFGWVVECFTGHYGDYQAVDARYHDFEHTLQGTLCLARLMQSRESTRALPRLTQRMFELGVAAILLHDTGYLKTRDDREGTGAKYTAMHVDRSAHFAAELLSAKGFSASDIRSVQNMILCTGVNAKIDSIPFQCDVDRIVGFALATADLLGQMAAEDYVEKLPTLYEEFAEAIQFTKSDSDFIASFESAEDLIRKTPLFWEKFVRARLSRDFLGLFKYLNHPYPSGPNEYVERIEANIERLRRQFVGAAERDVS